MATKRQENPMKPLIAASVVAAVVGLLFSGLANMVISPGDRITKLEAHTTEADKRIQNLEIAQAASSEQYKSLVEKLNELKTDVKLSNSKLDDLRGDLKASKK